MPQSERTVWHWAHAPHLQLHRHDSNLEANLSVLNEVRLRVDRYPDRFVMGEFSEEPDRCGGFAAPTKGLHSGYSFPLLHADRLDPTVIRMHYENLAHFPEHWPSIAFSNHDVARTPTRFGGANAPLALAKLLVTLLISLRGTILLFQGEELGLPEAQLRRDQLKDPVGDLYYPYSRGRDGCRTPMPWDDQAINLGFTTGTPWLPLSPDHRPLAVSLQERDNHSTLAYARELLATRRDSAALRLGEIEFVDCPMPVLAFVRAYGSERVLCVFNMSGERTSFRHALLDGAALLLASHTPAEFSGGYLDLTPFATWMGSTRLPK